MTPRIAPPRAALGRPVATAAILFLLLAGCAPRAAEPRLTPAQRELNVSSFDYVWTTIRDKHFDPQLNGADWDSAKAELRPKVEQAETMSGARAAMGELIARLGQTHFGIIPREAYGELERKPAKSDDAATRADEPADYPMDDDGSVGLDVRVVDGAALVVAVRPGLPGEQAGVRPGWIVMAIDGQAVAPVLERIAQGYADSQLKEMILTAAVQHRLTGRVGQELKVEFLDGADAKRTLPLTLAQPDGRSVKFGNLPKLYVRFDGHWVDENIAYLGISIFFDPLAVLKGVEEWARLAIERHAAGVIIDLRGNPGGIGGMSMAVAGWFIDQSNLKLGTMSTRDTALNFVVNPRPETYGGPVAILVDELSTSTSEIFAGGMQDLGRAKIFGRRTPGAALPSTIEKLPNGDGFQYAFANYVSQSGQQLEGHGVVPDVTVLPQRAALLRGEDLVLNAAVEWIRAQPSAAQ